MLASHQWLKELTGLALDARQMAEALTRGGLEVEGVHDKGAGLDGVIVVEVRGRRPHPTRDKLQIVSVFDGATVHEIVCGAPNVPQDGRLVLMASLGARLPNGVEITERELGGVVSRGMLCGETELDIGSDDSGLIVLERDVVATAGQLAVDALGLRDAVLEINVAPNRPDCLGHVGLARELCALSGTQMRPLPSVRASSVANASTSTWQSSDAAFELFPSTGVATEGFANAGVRVDIEDTERCPRYAASLVDAVSIGPSPFRVRYRLHVLGLRAISNVVDATNLILLGFGHPIHAFDFDKLAEGRIVVRRARSGESMTTLDGEKRSLTDDDLLVCDGQRPVALAGVMGGADSEISASTKRVLIECACFEPRGIRRTSRRTGLHTDSSHRFERGVDREDTRTVLAHATSMIADLAGGTVVAQALDVRTTAAGSIEIELRAQRVSALLGGAVPADEVQSVLKRLGCAVVPAASGWKVTPPSARIDLVREVDLIEEVARVRGYDQIPTQVPNVIPSSEGTPAEIRFTRRLREVAAGCGLNEAVNYAFVAPRDLELARVPTEAVRLANPMSEERSVLRTSLLPGLLSDLLRAQRHQVESFAQFELARVFTPGAVGELPEERQHFGALLCGARRRWIGDRTEADVYDLKGVMEDLLGGVTHVPLHTVMDAAVESGAPYLHPKRRATIVVEGVAVGRLGEVHPDVVEATQLSGRPVYAEIDVASLCDVVSAAGLPRARSLPRFPASVRDLAVIVPEEQAAGEVADLLRGAGGDLVEEVSVFDIYRGDPVERGHKSIAFRVVYRDREATLTDKVVETAHARLVGIAAERFGARLRS